nr:MAG TPA: UDP-N-acetyl-D-mannosaminuronate dehydrogenase [Caudoviricetes sp.]
MSKIKEKLINTGICIVGLGYVGLQLGCEFAKYIKVYGVDIDKTKICLYKNGIDLTESANIDLMQDIEYHSDINEIPDVKVYVVCVPTPIDENNKPNINALKNATISIAKKIKEGNLVVFESTVAPKTTNDICIPLLEQYSNLKCDYGFFVGYSPERLQAGKNSIKITDTTKLVAGNDFATLNMVYDLYNIILQKKQIHKCSSIEVAEMSKMLENVKRDVNIALMNQFQMICHEENIDFDDVLNAAETKFNFDSVKYKPGMVGGHCIGVDPYYLIDFVKNKNLVTLVENARNVNENVPSYIAQKIKEQLNDKENAKVTICGFSFKENCSDIRNTKIYDLYKILTDKFKYDVEIYDPKCSSADVYNQYGITLVDEVRNWNDCIFIALKEKEFALLDYTNKLSDDGFIFDYKNLFQEYSPITLANVWLDHIEYREDIPWTKIYSL